MIQQNSKMAEKLRNDELVTCTKLNVPTMAAAEIAAYAGFDCIWIDMEHVPSDYQEVMSALLAAKARGAETMVRVPRGCYSNLIRPLEMDAAAIMVPHCMSKKDAEEIAHYTKFQPIGRRPIDGGNGDGMYCLMGTDDYLKYSNEQKLTIIQIEDYEAYDELEEICSVPGIDMIFFGPADFAHSLGLAHDMGNPKIAEARRRVAEVARKHGKFAGTVGSTANLKELYDMGYRFVSMGADVIALGQYFTKIAQEAEEIKKTL